MAKPTSVPTWATNTNYAASSRPWAATVTKVQPPSGVQAEGLNPEDPTVAQYENYLRNLVGQWLTWVDGKFDVNEFLRRGSRVRHIPGSAGTIISTPAYSTNTNYHSGSLIQGRAVGNIFQIPIIVDEGERITSVVGWVACGTTDVWTMKVLKTTNSLGVGMTADNVQLGTTQTSAGHAGTIEALTVSGLTELVSSAIGVHYVAQFEITAFATNMLVSGIYVTTDVP